MPETTPAPSVAETIAIEMGEDGENFTTPKGGEFSSYLDQYEGSKHETDPDDPDRERWEFRDGSAIVFVEDDNDGMSNEGPSWDIEAKGHKFKQEYEV